MHSPVLTQINARWPVPCRSFSMQEVRPPMKICPRCRLAMQASRSGHTAAYDTFTCLRCDFVVAYKPGERETGTPGAGE